MYDVDSTTQPSALSKPNLKTFDFSPFDTFSAKDAQRNAHLSLCGNMSQNVAPWCPAGTRAKGGSQSHSSASFNLGFGDSVARPEELNCSGRGRATRARGGKCQTGRVPARVTAANPLFSRTVPPPRAPCYSAGTAHRYLSCVHTH
jgi:hypothetical protein